MGIQINAFILLIPSILRNVFLSHLAKVNNQEGQFGAILYKSIKASLFVSSLLLILIYSFLDVIVIFFGSEYSGLKSVILVLVTSTLFESISNVFTQAYLSKGENWFLLVLKFLRGTGTAACMFFLMKSDLGLNGSMAMAYSYATFNVLFLAMQWIWFVRYLK